MSQYSFTARLLTVLIGGNRNDLQCKFLWYLSFQSYGNENLIIKKISSQFFNEIVKGEYTCLLNLSRDISTKFTLIFLYHFHILVPVTKPTKIPSCFNAKDNLSDCKNKILK